MPEPAGRVVTVVAAAATAVLVAATAAGAGFRDAASASTSVASGRLVAATAPSATAGCTLLVPRVTLAWTPTVTVTATGYRLYRKVGTGSFTLLTTVAGRASNGYVDTPLSGATSYSYYVEAYVGSWTASTATVSATTALLCL